MCQGGAVLESSTLLIWVLFHLSSCALLGGGFNPFYKSSKLLWKHERLSGSDLGSTFSSAWGLVAPWSWRSGQCFHKDWWGWHPEVIKHVKYQLSQNSLKGRHGPNTNSTASEVHYLKSFLPNAVPQQVGSFFFISSNNSFIEYTFWSGAPDFVCST